jgi:hypothetical protein
MTRPVPGGDRRRLRHHPATPTVGVDLACMRERAAELGGTCTITAPPPDGTRVSAHLPCQDQPTAAGSDQPANKESPAVAEPISLLIADDHEHLRAGMRALLPATPTSRWSARRAPASRRSRGRRASSPMWS